MQKQLPRERSLQEGLEVLSEQELLALVLGTGTSRKSVLELSSDLLVRLGGIKGVSEASLQELLAIEGIGVARALQIKAAIALGKKASTKPFCLYRKMSSITDVVELASPLIGGLKQEALLVILRDVKARMIHHQVISLGSVSDVFVHPREIFYLAVKHLAHSLIICHNHPSGDPTPSEADYLLTKQLLQCSQMMNIQLVEHIIIAHDRYHSLLQGYSALKFC